MIKLKFLCFIFLLILLMSHHAFSSQITNLSGNFIDPQSAPLVMEGRAFAKSVIYENKLMYAPAIDFISDLGIASDLQGLPNQFTLNGQSAPLYLLATGPDRYTGETIYYLNVTWTLEFLSISYNVAAIPEGIQVTVAGGSAGPVSPVTEPSGKTGSISGVVVITTPIQSGSIKLTEEYLNTARILSTREVASGGLSVDGKFAFTGLPAGKYTVTASSTSTDKGELMYNQVTKQYYYDIRTVTTTWSKALELGEGENANIQLTGGESSTSIQTQYVNPPNNN